MAKKKATKETCSLDEEMLMWTSYRYCIGRKTYVSSMAGYIAKKYYHLLNDDRLEHSARDIRNCILDSLRWSPFDFNYDGTVPSEERKPLEDLLTFMTTNNIDSEEKVLGVEKVTVYRDSYARNEPNRYRVTNKCPEVQRHVYQNDIDVLRPWMNLASCFDKKNHQLLHVKFDGKEEDIIAFESWVIETKECEDSPGYYRMNPWHWKKVYVSVDDFVNKGEYAGYIVSDYIESIKDNPYENVDI